MQLSIIIPAYNAVKYLRRCVESLACQNLSIDCYEAIVINDGSTDNTESLLDDLCSEFSFLKYVTTINRGLSCARNLGIEEATGEFLFFLDADDSLSENTLGLVCCEMAEYELDMMLVNYRHIALDGVLLQIPFRMDENSKIPVTGKEFLLHDTYPPMVCMYAYRRSFLMENKLVMMPIGHEDEEFTPRAICLAGKIKYYPLIVYNYFQNSDSYMNHYKESNFLYFIEAMGSLNTFKQLYNTDAEIKRYFENHIARTILRLFKNSIIRGYQNQRFMVDKMHEVGLRFLKPKKLNFYFCLFNVSPFLFERYYRLIKRKPRSSQNGNVV